MKKIVIMIIEGDGANDALDASSRMTEKKQPILTHTHRKKT